MSFISLGASVAVTLQANATITAATNAAPIAVTTSAAHGLLTGDIVQISGAVGNLGTNGQFVITKTSSTAFTLNNSNGSGAWSSGGTVVHIGRVLGSALVDNTVFSTVPAYVLQARVESLPAAVNCRVEFTDAADSAFVTEQSLATFEKKGAVGTAGYSGGPLSYDDMFSAKYETLPDARLASSGDNFRCKVFCNQGAGSTFQVSAWLMY